MLKRILLLICLLTPLAYGGYQWCARAISLRHQRAAAAAEEALERGLQTKVSLYEISGDAVPLDDLLRELSRQSGIAIRCDAAHLDELNIDENAPVRVPAADLRLGAALRYALQQHDLAAVNRGDYLWITTCDAAGEIRSARLHRLPTSPNGTTAAIEDEQAWIELIHLVRSGTWAEMGGLGQGHVEPLPGALLVVNTEDVHREVAELLRQFEHPVQPHGGSFYENLGSPDDLRIHEALRRPASVFFSQVPLREAMKHLQAEHDVPIVLREWKLSEAGISLDVPVTKTLRTISLGAVLDQVLGELELAYTVRGGVVQITTWEDAEDDLRTVVYDVDELFEDKAGARDFDSLIDLITAIIAPQSWDEVGGPGSLQGFGDRWLAFTQTDRIHAQVAELLTGVRQHLAPSAGRSNPPALESEPLAECRARAALERQIALDLGTIPLCDLCEFLSETLAVNVVCQQRRLDEIAVPLDVPIDCRLPKMELWKGLELLLEPLDLAVVVRDEVLLITSQEDARSTLETRIYDVRSFDPGPIYVDPGSARNDALVDVLIASVRPSDWDDNGGPGAIERFCGLLVVSQTPAAHREVRRLLDVFQEMAARDAENPAKAD